jgi:hypothetical protein
MDKTQNKATSSHQMPDMSTDRLRSRSRGGE